MANGSSPSKNRVRPGCCAALKVRLDCSGFRRLGGECCRHGCGQKHASGDGEETHDSGAGTDASFPQLASAFVAVGTEFGRTLLSAALGRF